MKTACQPLWTSAYSIFAPECELSVSQLGVGGLYEENEGRESLFHPLEDSVFKHKVSSSVMDILFYALDIRFLSIFSPLTILSSIHFSKI